MSHNAVLFGVSLTRTAAAALSGQSRGLKSFAESLITALALNENEAEELRSLVEGAAWDGKRQ
eukprot:46923-Eustigmatos_ZCMA.PRE.1